MWAFDGVRAISMVDSIIFELHNFTREPVHAVRSILSTRLLVYTRRRRERENEVKKQIVETAFQSTNYYRKVLYSSILFHFIWRNYLCTQNRSHSNSAEGNLHHSTEELRLSFTRKSIDDEIGQRSKTKLKNQNEWAIARTFITRKMNCKTVDCERAVGVVVVVFDSIEPTPHTRTH